MSHVSHIHFRSRAERRNLRRKEKYAEMDRKYAEKVRQLRCLYISDLQYQKCAVKEVDDKYAEKVQQLKCVRTSNLIGQMLS